MERARGYKQKKKGTNKTLGVEANEKNKGKLSVSSMDFVGLGFADKKDGRTLPAGLVPIADDFAQGNLPEVEIIVGDSSNFGAATPKPQGDDPPDLNKPKVSSWGVFPRPNDISKTFGGGRVIRPGEVLETQEEIAAKEERTRQLVAAYNTKMGLNIDPKLRLDCEKTLKDGDSLMNVGKLKEALPYYEKVMDKLTFKIMTPKARADIHINLPALKKLDSMLIETLDSMVDTEFGYVEGGSRAEGRNRTPGQSKRWWLPSPQVPATGLYRAKNKLLKQGKVVHQVFKAARTINESVLEMHVPTIIRDALPKVVKFFLV